jgi:hypothetical protein
MRAIQKLYDAYQVSIIHIYPMRKFVFIGCSGERIRGLVSENGSVPEKVC